MRYGRSAKPFFRPEWIPTGSNFHLKPTSNEIQDGIVIPDNDSEYEEEPKTFEQSLRVAEPLPIVKPDMSSPRRKLNMNHSTTMSSKSLVDFTPTRTGRSQSPTRSSSKIKRKDEKKKKLNKTGTKKPTPKSEETKSEETKSEETRSEETRSEETESEETKSDLDKALRAMFLEADTDHNGHLNMKELKKMLINVTANDSSTSSSTTSLFTESDIERIFKAFDVDGSGTVEESEFVDWITSGLSRTKKERAAFALRSELAKKLDIFLTAVFCRAQEWNKRVLKKNIHLKHMIGHKSNPNKKKKKQSKEKEEQKKLKKEEQNVVHPGIRAIFQEFDKNNNGHLDIDELQQLLKVIPERGGVVIKSDFTSNDCSRVFEAFDEDGNGIVDEDEFVNWVALGLSQTKESRRKFAKRTVLAAKLERFLTAIEVIISKWSHKQKLAKQKKKSTKVNNNKSMQKNVETSPSNNGNAPPSSSSQYQPIYSPNHSNASSAANLSSSIYFDYRNLQFGRTVLRTSKKKSINLINDTDYDISVLLSIKAGSGFNIIKPKGAESFRRFLIVPRSKLKVPIRYHPILLGSSNVAMVAKCTTINHGRAVFRVVTNLSGAGV